MSREDEAEQEDGSNTSERVEPLVLAGRVDDQEHDDPGQDGQPEDQGDVPVESIRAALFSRGSFNWLEQPIDGTR